MRDRFLGVFFAAVAVFGMAFALSRCGDTKDIPNPTSPVAVATPAQQEVTPSQVGGGVGDSWTEHGVKVTVIADEWGAGSCHTSGGARTLRIENGRDHEIYSLLAAYTDPGLTCATQHTVTGKPNMSGPTHIAAGQTAEVTYTVTIPECGSLQADDCWGPGGLQGCSYVIGDGFKSTKVCDECAEDPKKTSKCGEWNECHEHPEDGCWQEKECVETIDYQCKPDIERKYEEKQRCECDCDEGGPYGPKDVDGPVWFPEILEGSCPNGPTALHQHEQVLEVSPGSWDRMPSFTGNVFTPSCDPKCHQLGEQAWITTYDCKDPERGTRPLCRPADCPKPEGLCHVSNKGSDRNMNMVITRNGHQHHANRCPPDLPNSQCDCTNVIASAEACNPGATNYDCKDTR